MRAYQLPTEQYAQDDGGNCQTFDPAIGFDQHGGGQQLSEDAVLGGGIRRRTQTDDGVGEQRVRAKQHHRTTQHLDAIAHEHHLSLGARICKSTHKRCEHHIKQSKHGHQSGALPFGTPTGFDQLDCGHKQSVVGQRAEKLRRHDGVKTALHK